MTAIEQRFDSVSEWLAFVRSPTDAEDEDRSSVNADYTFTQTHSLLEAIDLAERGWDDGVRHVSRLSAQISDQIVAKLRVPEVRYDVVGDCIDIGRYVTGEPETFMQIVPAEIEQEPKVLHIVFNASVSGITSRETLIARGASVVSLVDALEQHGKRIIVDCVGATESRRGQRTYTYVRVKDADGPVQLANLVYLLAHPSTLRRLMFASWEHCTAVQRRLGGFSSSAGYGMVGSPPRDQQGDIYIHGLDWREGSWETPASSIAWVLQQLKQQGIYAEREEAAT